MVLPAKRSYSRAGGKSNVRKRAVVMLTVALGLGACGASQSPKESSMQFHEIGTQMSDLEGQQKGPLKAIKWGVVASGQQSIEIGALVPYCEKSSPKPHIERIEKRFRHNRVIITMFVRFPPKRVGSNAGGCLGVEIGISRWVKLRKKSDRIRLYDGSTSPPARRALR